MRHFVIGMDSLGKPTESALVIGPEVDDDKVRGDFYAAREKGESLEGWDVIVLYGERGVIDVAIARPKPVEAEEETEQDPPESSSKKKKHGIFGR